MKFKTRTGRVKDIPIHRYLIDWTAKKYDSEFSTEVIRLLEPYWRRDIILTQVPVAGTRMSYDFVNITKKIVLENDGEQHGRYNSFMHNGSPLNYGAQITRDLDKDALAELNGFQMVRIKPEDLPKLRVSIKNWFRATYDITL